MSEEDREKIRSGVALECEKVFGFVYITMATTRLMGVMYYLRPLPATASGWGELNRAFTNAF